MWKGAAILAATEEDFSSAAIRPAWVRRCRELGNQDLVPAPGRGSGRARTRVGARIVGLERDVLDQHAVRLEFEPSLDGLRPAEQQADAFYKFSS